MLAKEFDNPDVITIGESMVVFNPIVNTTFNDSHLFMKQIAGAESNYAIGLSRLGHKVGWISRISHDSFGYFIRDTIRGNGVDVSQVQIDKEFQTGVLIKEKMIGNQVNVHYYRENSAASNMSPSIINKNYFVKAKYLFITGITPLLSESCENTIIEAIESAKENNVKIIFDPNIRYKLIKDKSRYLKLIHKILLNTDYFLPGFSEAKYICGKNEKQKIFKHFLEAYPNLNIIMKLGAQGCSFANVSETFDVPGYKVENLVDPIGAGDGFAVGFTNGLLEGKSIFESLKLANLIGSIVIQTPGDMEGLPYKHQLIDLINLQNNDEDVNR